MSTLRPSNWSYKTGATGGVSIEFVVASGGTVVLADPAGAETDFYYGGIGVGVGFGLRVPKIKLPRFSLPELKIPKISDGRRMMSRPIKRAAAHGAMTAIRSGTARAAPIQSEPR